MGSSVVVIVDVGGQNSVEVPCSKDQDPVEAFLAHRPNPAFRDRVRVRRPKWCLHDCHVLRHEDRVEGSRKLAVTVVNQEAGWHSPVLDLPAELARLLRYPGTCRLCSAASHMNASTTKLDPEEHIESPEPSSFDREEVT